MSFDACAAIVEKGDPDRFRSAMAAPVRARPVLFALYALNVEVARAPWVTAEPMIAEMRLQWWRDALEEIAQGQTPRRHEVVDELAKVLTADAATDLDALVAARRWDIYSDPFEDAAHFNDYLNATSGRLMLAAAQALGSADPDVVGDFAYAAGVANLLRAIPDLEDRGRKPLLDGRPEGVQALAADGLARLSRAAKRRKDISSEAAPALLAGWAARPVLELALKSPGRVAGGALLPGPFRLAKVSLLGWWR